MKGFRCKLVTWNEIEKWVRMIVKKMKEDDFRPEIVIGLARGGLIPARLISDYLQVKDLYAVKTEHWGITASPDGTARITQKLPISVENKRVLVVDDITDTGQSLSLAVDHINSYKPKELRSATLLHITHSKYVPHYFAEIVPEENWTWFIFPWNVYEDLTTIVPKVLEEGPKSYDNIISDLEKYFYIKPTKKKLYETLNILIEKNIIALRNGLYTKL